MFVREDTANENEICRVYISVTSCQGRSWSRLPCVPSLSMCRTTRGSGPARMGLGKAACVSLACSPFCDKVTCHVDVGRAVDVLLEFSEAFGSVFCSIFLEKLASHGVDR